MPNPVKLSILIIVLFIGSACNPGNDAVGEPVDVNEWLPLRIDEVELNAQIALTHSEMQRGLMHRDSLPDNGGMLFAYATPRRASFWMLNTRIPLDIGFFDREGVLLEIHRMVPFDTQTTVSRSENVSFALEMNLGWFGLQRLYPGARLDLQLLRQTLRQRGVNPADYGL